LGGEQSDRWGFKEEPDFQKAKRVWKWWGGTKPRRNVCFRKVPISVGNRDTDSAGNLRKKNKTNHLCQSNSRNGWNGIGDECDQQKGV